MTPRLPVDKHDTAAIEALVGLSNAEIVGVMSDLLLWTQDANWPVAQRLAQIMPSFGEHLAPAASLILHSDDADWKAHFLCLLQRGAEPEQIRALRPELERLVHDATQANRDVKPLAQELLNHIS